jgi:hypothetical protein
VEALTRLVADSLARHGLDRPIDPRRLQWSRWFRCDSPHSLLVVPSKPGIFALAEEIAANVARVPSPATSERFTDREGHDFSRATSTSPTSEALAAEVMPAKRMLAVLQFSEDDDMAFVLDRMFTRINPMRARLASGRCFLRFVVIDDQAQRRSICNALNQWMLSSAEKASGLPADFSSSLEFTDCVGTTRVGRTLPSASSEPALSRSKGQALSDNADCTLTPAQTAKAAQASDVAPTAPNLDSGANKNLHCPHPLPSGF